jgi:predicted transcriptional regulator
MIAMLSVTVELDEQVAEAVRNMAAAQRRSECEIVQEAVAAYAHNARPMPQGMGKYRSGQADVSERAEDILSNSAKERRWP